MFPACKGLPRDEQMKCFEEQMAKAVAKNAVYPDKDLEKGKQGVALISFIIDENGKIIDVKAIDNKRATPEMQKAAEKAVQKVSKLTPAKQGGNPVRIKYSIPVSFKIK
jgi:protein TonB